MRSPQDMKIIQIDITNACVNRCSNCTRFCGHHRKPFFMDFETFKKAVDSFDGWDGCVGIIGGEPTLHPELEKFLDYLREKRIGKTFTVARKPISNMQKYIYSDFRHGDSKIGFWSSLNKGYYRHFETINDTFNYQVLNDHNNKCLHQAILMSRKDLGIADEEFIKRRDNCFAQNTWSATVTPKGAFFCEVAGALDMLFNGPGGWEIEQGWWKRKPEEFGDQLKWCELCSLCLDVPKRISCEDIDDISPTLYEKLKEIGSPKLAKRRYCLHTKDDYMKKKKNYKSFERENDYMAAGGNIRTTKENKNYYPRKFDITTIENVGKIIQKNSDWTVISKNEKDAKKVVKYLKKHVINPGCIYKYKEEIVFNILARSIREYMRKPMDFDFSKIECCYPQDKIICVDIKNGFLGRKIKKIIDKIPVVFKYRW